MKDFSAVIKAWPSSADLANDLGVDRPAISLWKHRKSIPSEYWWAITKAAKRRRIRITADILVKLGANGHG